MTSFLVDKLVEKALPIQEIMQEINLRKVFKETALGISTKTPLMLFAFFLLSSPGSVFAVDDIAIPEILKPKQAADTIKNLGRLFTHPLTTIAVFADLKVFLDPTVPIVNKSILGGKYFCCASYITLANIRYVFPVRAVAIKNALNVCCLASWAGYSALHAIDPGNFKE
jgi:hypothetical protein